MRLKFPEIADPPDVIADAVALLIMPGEFAAANFFTERNRFQDRAIAKASTDDVVTFSYSRLTTAGRKRFHQIEAANVIAPLFALVTDAAIGPADDATLHQVSKKPVQLSASVSWAGQTAAAKTRRRHSEIAAILLHQNIRRHFRGPKKRMLGRIDAHRFGNSRFEFVTGLDFPARFEFAQRQTIGSIAVHLIGGRKNERRFRAVFARRLEQIQGAVGIDREIGLRLSRGPIM